MPLGWETTSATSRVAAGTGERLRVSERINENKNKIKTDKSLDFVYKKKPFHNKNG